MGLFSGLDVEDYDRQYSDRVLIKRIAGYFRPHLGRLFWIIFFLLVGSASGAAIPIMVSQAVDDIQGGVTDEQIWFLGGAVFLAGFLVWLGNWIRRLISARMIGDMVMEIRVDAFAASAEHDLSFYDEFSSGKIVSRITSDTRDFGQMVTVVADLLASVIQAVLVGVVLANLNARLMWYVMGFMPVIFFLASGFRSMARKATQKGFRAMGNVNATIKETVSGISVAKNFRQEGSIFAEFDEANFSSYKVNMVRGFIFAIVFPVLILVGGISQGAMIYIGGNEVANGIITAGVWYLFIQSLNYFWFPVLNLAAFWAQFQAGLSASERSFALIDADPKVHQTAQEDVARVQGKIEFKQMDFRYSEQEKILEGFNLEIGAGENIALVGHTGAGKSSIAKVVARFYEFQAGELLVDGKDIRNFDLAQYRKQLGIVSQTPFLFSGTVAENIRYARPDAPDDEIMALANKIGDGEWMDTLPNGLETQVGERGGRLSMGQRQLVSLMRVLVQDPAIFILDEATASIDPFTEWQIQQALNLILKNTTSIMIAHRLSTIKAADRIIVLDDGSIIEEGNHDRLMEQKGHYATLYNTYFRHQSLAYVEEAVGLADIS